MTTTPARTIEMPADALADLYRGHLQIQVGLDHHWSLGLIFADGALEPDALLAEKMQTAGVGILWLHEEHLHQLATGEPTELTCTGQRYLITVEDVEQLDELLEDEE